MRRTFESCRGHRSFLLTNLRIGAGRRGWDFEGGLDVVAGAGADLVYEDLQEVLLGGDFAVGDCEGDSLTEFVEVLLSGQVATADTGGGGSGCTVPKHHHHSFWDTVGEVAGYVAVGAGVVVVTIGTAGIGDVVIGGVSLGTVATVGTGIGIGAGAVATGVDCGENPRSVKCALDAGSLVLAGGGAVSEELGANRWLTQGLNGASAAAGGAAIYSPGDSNPCR